ncbi:hypothetical protein Tco_1387756 [Tanacetum coccineum]
MKGIDTFVPMDQEVENENQENAEGSDKREGAALEQKSSKKQKKVNIKFRGGLLGLKDFLSAVGITSKCSRLMLKLLLLNTMIKTAEVSYCCLEKLLLLSIISTAGTRINAAEGLLLLEDLMLSDKISRPYQRKDKDDLKIKIRICYL